jgi:GAF domain-containing protein
VGPGVIDVVNSTRGDAFSDDALVLLESLANSIALAINNAAQVTQLKTFERTLRT